MKKLMLAALAAFMVTGSAWAGMTDVVTLADGTCWNIKSGDRVDCVTGAVIVAGTNLDRDYAFNHFLLSDSMAISSFQDSSAFVATGTASQLYLKIKVTIPTGTPANMWVRLAFQVRQADENPALNDTTLISNWRPSVGANTTATDSLVYGTVRAGTAGALGNGIAGSDEFVVVLADFKNTATAAASGPFTTTARVPLADNRGVFAWAPFTAVRPRVLACGSAGTPIVTLSLVGRP